LQYFKNLIQIPTLPAHPPNFRKTHDFHSYVKPIVIVPEHEDNSFEDDNMSLLVDLTEDKTVNNNPFADDKANVNSPFANESFMMYQNYINEIESLKQEIERLKFEHEREIKSLNEKIKSLQEDLLNTKSELEQQKIVNFIL
jgi:hypothetical protein